MSLSWASPIVRAAPPQFFFSPPRSSCASFPMPLHWMMIRRQAYEALCLDRWVFLWSLRLVVVAGVLDRHPWISRLLLKRCPPVLAYLLLERSARRSNHRDRHWALGYARGISFSSRFRGECFSWTLTDTNMSARSPFWSPQAASMSALRSPLIPKRSQFPEVAVFRTTRWTSCRKV